MSRITFSQWTKNLFRRQQGTRKGRKMHRSSTFEHLGERITPAVNALFFDGQLTILGDAANNIVAVSRDAAGNLLVNGGAVRVQGGAATVANTQAHSNLRSRRGRHSFSRRSEWGSSAGKYFRRCRKRHAHRRLRHRLPVWRRRRRQAVRQRRRGLLVRRHRQRHPDGRRRQRPGLRRGRKRPDDLESRRRHRSQRGRRRQRYRRSERRQRRREVHDHRQRHARSLRPRQTRPRSRSTSAAPRISSSMPMAATTKSPPATAWPD